MQLGRHREKLLFAALRWSLRKSKLIIANSQAGVDGYTALGLIDTSQARVIRNGTDIDEFQLATAIVVVVAYLIFIGILTLTDNKN
jgi:hypothetical protein